MKDSTISLHVGEKRIEGAVNTPIFQSAIFTAQDGQDYTNISYMRMSNTPTHESVHAKLAALEQTESALTSSSGMASIAASILAHTSRGGHILAQKTLYGGTYSFLTQLAERFGLNVSFFDPNSSDWPIQKNTELIYVESINNPLIEPLPCQKVVDFAKSHGILSMIDNTVATPFNLKPITLGFDLSLHSATKTLNGHSDLVAGCVMGRTELILPIRKYQALLGGSLDAHTAFLLYRGLKTAKLRSERQNQNTLELANWLRKQPGVQRVNYPFSEVPGFSGFGGLLSFELDGGVPRSKKFIESIEYAVDAPSLGGVESLITRPSVSSHASMTAEQRAQAGISDSLIRMSIGIEDLDDLKSDILQALSKSASAGE